MVRGEPPAPLSHGRGAGGQGHTAGAAPEMIPRLIRFVEAKIKEPEEKWF